MYFKVKVFNPYTDLYCWDYFVSDDNDHPWVQAALYAEFIECCGCPIITIDLCSNEEVSMVMEKTTKVIEYYEYDIRGTQRWWEDENAWFEEV